MERVAEADASGGLREHHALLARHRHNLYPFQSALGKVRTRQVRRWSLPDFKSTRYQQTDSRRTLAVDIWPVGDPQRPKVCNER
jgi:hypothetical protein